MANFKITGSLDAFKKIEISYVCSLIIIILQLGKWWCWWFRWVERCVCVVVGGTFHLYTKHRQHTNTAQYRAGTLHHAQSLGKFVGAAASSPHSCGGFHSLLSRLILFPAPPPPPKSHINLIDPLPSTSDPRTLTVPLFQVFVLSRVSSACAVTCSLHGCCRHSAHLIYFM